MRKPLSLMRRLILAAIVTAAATWTFGARVLLHTGAGPVDRWVSGGLVGVVCGAVVLAWTGSLALSTPARDGNSSSELGVAVRLPVWAALLDPICWPEEWLAASDRAEDE